MILELSYPEVPLLMPSLFALPSKWKKMKNATHHSSVSESKPEPEPSRTALNEGSSPDQCRSDNGADNVSGFTPHAYQNRVVKRKFMLPSNAGRSGGCRFDELLQKYKVPSRGDVVEHRRDVLDGHTSVVP